MITDAAEFRKQGAAKGRSKAEGFNGVYFGPCNTLSTRIRVDVSNLYLLNILL